MVITTFDNKMKTLQMLNKVKGLHFFGKILAQCFQVL